MKENYTHIVLLVDRSGSMMYTRADAQGGINALLEDQAKVAGDCTISLYEFDDRYDLVYGPVAISQAPKYHLEPRGNTALLDATARAIRDTGEFLRELPEGLRPSKVIFTIVTDGQENASRETTPEQVRESIKHQTDVYGWEFMYIGSSADTFADAQRIGIANTIQYTNDAVGTRSAYTAYSSAMAATRTTGGSVTANMAHIVQTDGDTLLTVNTDSE